MSTEISGSIKTDIQIDGDVYDVTVDVPTGKPGAESPYELLIYNQTLQGNTPAGEYVPKLLWMEAYYSDPESNLETTPENMYLELGPPSSILPNGTTFAINNLSIVFATGAFVGNPPADDIKGTAES